MYTFLCNCATCRVPGPPLKGPLHVIFFPPTAERGFCFSGSLGESEGWSEEQYLELTSHVSNFLFFFCATLAPSPQFLLFYHSPKIRGLLIQGRVGPPLDTLKIGLPL